jgi:hypothetical protein
MFRFLALSAAVLLAHASLVQAGPLSIVIAGQLAGGNNVSANCTIANGQITGTGVLYGTNLSTGAAYRYPFTISKGTTANGKLVLTGKIVNGPPMTLSCSVPNGPMVFKYVVNGNTYSLAGLGTVTFQ